MIGVKYDNGKPDLLSCFKKMPFKQKDFTFKKSDIEIDINNLFYNLLPDKSIKEIVKVLNYGAKKYSPDNWKHVKPFKIRYMSALLRHLFQWYVLKEKNDKESGFNHLAHSACCILFLLEKELKNDRK
jgi:hypothetical protein